MTIIMNSLRDLYIEQLQDLYNAETQLIDVLPRMGQAASSRELEEDFAHHLGQARSHINQLNEIFKIMGREREEKRCGGMEGIVEEGKEAIQIKGNEAVKDAALIAAAQRVEHYEIAGYGTVRMYAERLGETRATEILDAILNEEKRTNEKLAAFAEGEAASHA